MGIFSKSGPKIDRDGGVIGLPFAYEPLRDPRLQPVEMIDLVPSASSKVETSDEFYAKFHALVIQNRIDTTVFSTWAKVERTEFDDYKSINLGEVEYSRFARAAMTGYLMAVCEEDVFKTFRQNEMATYLVGAMQIYINDIEHETSVDAKKVLLTGLLSGYHKAHSMYKNKD